MEWVLTKGRGRAKWKGREIQREFWGKTLWSEGGEREREKKGLRSGLKSICICDDKVIANV